MHTDILNSLFYNWAGEECISMLALGANGSNRQYWRMQGNHHRCIASYNADVRENEAFFYYAKALYDRGVHVPQVYSVDASRCYYLQQDLDDTTLYGHLYDKRRRGVGFDAEALTLYRQVLDDLAFIQVVGRDVDFSQAYPRSRFDAQSIAWDLQYFKYYFLKLAGVPFDEELLERDFRTFSDYLLSTDCDYFLYRDFQARNIMLVGDTPYYIDFQGGRQGAAQYDVASLLYSAKSELPEPIRQELLNHYIVCLQKHVDTYAKEHPDTKIPQVSVDGFKDYFYAYVLVRIMQAMGAYGYRGYFERKPYFLTSIPLAINNLRLVLENHPLPFQVSHLTQVLKGLTTLTPSSATDSRANSQLSTLNSQLSTLNSPLTVTVTSFSYKLGLPQDASGNGGGFVFDCRALPNPGREPEFRSYTGRDLPVIKYLQGDPLVEAFLADAQSMVGASVRNYLERHFTNLSVSFGCTGGQHRSVYCAERMARWITDNFDCRVVLVHREQHA